MERQALYDQIKYHLKGYVESLEDAGMHCTCKPIPPRTDYAKNKASMDCLRTRSHGRPQRCCFGAGLSRSNEIQVEDLT